MGWNDVKIKPSQLDVVKRQAIKLEEAYMLERMFLPLKSKYRPPYGGASQWGTGSDMSGKAQHAAKTAKTKNVGPPHVMKVDGRTGKVRMVSQ